MNVEIICVGTELLLGDILNTNAKYLSEKLALLGFNLYSQSVVGDNFERLEAQIKESLGRSEVIILSGGLGPTPDDITKETVAKVLNLPLTEHSQSLQRIKNYFKKIGREMPENNKKQALTIEGAMVLPNEYGTAPGYCVTQNNSMVFLLPGPPSELIPMFENHVTPILKMLSKKTIISHNIRVFGVGESAVAEGCGTLLESSNPTVATYAKTGEVDIRVTASANTAEKVDVLCAPFINKITTLFDENVYGVDCENLQQAVVELLKSKKMKLATAESCTAGMLSSRITEIPGSSEVFEMGVTAYANYVKTQALGVNSDIIKKYGAVCPEVAAQMAVGIRTMCSADIGLGITGVAGPGQSEGKPAGLVYVALADKQKVFVRKIMCRGTDRENTRIVASSTALDMARRYLEDRKEFLSNGTLIGKPIKLMEGYNLPDNTSYDILSEIVSDMAEQSPIFDSEEENLTVNESFEFIANDSKEDSVLNKEQNLPEEHTDFVFDDDFEEPLAEENLNIKEKISDLEKTKKPSFFAKLFPTKADSVSEKIRKLLFLISFVVLIGTMGYLIIYFAQSYFQTQMVSNAAKTWTDKESMEKNSDGVFIGFEELMKANSDIKAWIKIDDTNINNPVYQTTDNDFYIKHNMNKEKSRYGALFIDKDSVIGKNSNSQNVIIYGHHMRDGTMFANLKKYLDINFYKKHSTIEFNTLYREGEYKVFAVFITNTKPEDDNGEVFNYRYSYFNNDDEFLNWIDEVKMRSVIDTGVEVTAEDEIITLSTCTYEFDDARLVVMAKRMDDDEIIDTSLAKVNPNPLYPEIWYTKKGIKKPNFSSVTSSDVQSSDIQSSDTSSEFNSSTESITSSVSSSVQSSNATSSRKVSSYVSSTSGTASAGSSSAISSAISSNIPGTESTNNISSVLSSVDSSISSASSSVDNSSDISSITTDGESE